MKYYENLCSDISMPLTNSIMEKYDFREAYIGGESYTIDLEEVKKEIKRNFEKALEYPFSNKDWS